MDEDELQRLEDVAQTINRAVEEFGDHVARLTIAAEKIATASSRIESAGGMISMAAGRMQG